LIVLLTCEYFYCRLPKDALGFSAFAREAVVLNEPDENHAVLCVGEAVRRVGASVAKGGFADGETKAVALRQLRRCLPAG